MEQTNHMSDVGNLDELMTGSLIAGRYKIMKRIGRGSFGLVYLAVNITNNSEVAIKLETCGNSSFQVVYESKVYRILSDGKHVPYAKLYHTSDQKKALVMDLLGPSLEELFNFCNREFSLKTVCMLADQLIMIMEYIHTHSIIHCDIKPDNFLMGIASICNRVFMIDFGLSKQFRQAPSMSHVKYSNTKSLTGTARYVSINSHIGIGPSRRDDLESLGYVLIYFCVEQLPWQGINCHGRKQKYDRICEKKLSTPVSHLCKDLPMEFILYINYCRSLRYDETPDYIFLRQLFRTLIRSLNYRYDFVFDWLIPERYDKVKKLLMESSSELCEKILAAGHLPINDEENVDNKRKLSENTTSESKNSVRYSFAIKNFYKSILVLPTNCTSVVTTYGSQKPLFITGNKLTGSKM